MEEQKKNKKLQVKSPIIMSGKSKMALLDCNIQSIPKLKGLDDVSKVYSSINIYNDRR